MISLRKMCQLILTISIRTMKQTCSDWVKVKCNAIDAAQKQAGDPKNEEIIRRKLEELREFGI